MFESVRALLEGVVDYAGLFPPAGLGMAEAVANYHRYLEGPESWMLGRLIVPASRLTEFETALLAAPRRARRQVSALAGPDLMATVSQVLAFNAHVRDAIIDSIEFKAESTEAIRKAVAGVPPGFLLYAEIPVDPDPGPLIKTIAEAGCRAKMRTGGTLADAFPSTSDVARFIRRCDESKVAFKATAGLHHPLRGDYALTYEPESAVAPMHGFLNVLLAVAFRWAIVADEEMSELLEAPSPQLTFSRRGIGWRDRWISTAQIQRSRERLAVSFGSCSFKEPVDGLREKGLL